MKDEPSGKNRPGAQDTASYARGQDLSGNLEGAGGIGGLLARSDQYSGGTWGRHVVDHADGNGNVTALIDSAQAVAAAYRYNPYGQLLGSSGSLAGVNTLRFSSKQMHPSVGLYYYGYRFYDPNLQRWINRDPIGERGGVNLYAFTGNNPANSVDAYGLIRIPGLPGLACKSSSRCHRRRALLWRGFLWRGVGAGLERGYG